MGIRIWSPGQVLEGQLGFDATLSVANAFWTMLGQPAAPGVYLARYGLSPMVRRSRPPLAGPDDQLPDFSTNLFLQVKRPFKYKEPPAEVTSLGIGQPTWFFDVTPHQQVLLETLTAHLGNLADVRYGCAAFFTKKQLFDFTLNRGLVPRSTFPQAISLKGHERWAYDSGGTRGVGFSEPALIESIPLPKQIDVLAARHAAPQPRFYAEGERGLSAEQIKKELGRRGDLLVPQLEKIEVALSAALKALPADQAELVQSIESRLRGIGGNLSRHAQLVIQISTMTAHLGLLWFAVGPDRQGG